MTMTRCIRSLLHSRLLPVQLVNMYCQHMLDTVCHTSQGCPVRNNCICYEPKDARVSICPL